MAIEIEHKHRIVHVYQDLNAPTGEGTIRVDEDGTHWRDVLYFDGPKGTGDRRGHRRNGVIYEFD